MDQAAPQHATTPVNAGSDPDAPNDALRACPAMIIRMRLRAGAAIPGRFSTHPLCPLIAGHGGPSEECTYPAGKTTRLLPAAATAKSPAQGRISIESHLRSSTEPTISSRVHCCLRSARCSQFFQGSWPSPIDSGCCSRRVRQSGVETGPYSVGRTAWLVA